jgi:phosphoglucosamine mutase
MPPETLVEYPRVYGTDGIRNKLGEGFMQEAYMNPLGYAIGSIVANRGECMLSVRDTRPNNDLLQAWITDGIRDAGVDVLDLGVAPTPAIAYLLREAKEAPKRGGDISPFAGGVDFTASHNSADYLGQKNFGRSGHKLPDELEDKISDRMWQIRDGLYQSRYGKQGSLADGSELLEIYKGFLKSHGEGIDFSKIRFGLDCANGGASSLAPEILFELGARFKAINADPRAGDKINENCGATHLDAVRQLVREEGLDFGVAFDGDADRVLFVTKSGREFDGDQVLHMLARHHRVEGVVTTIMTNMGIEAALREQGIVMDRAGVGDRYVAENLGKTGYPFGGEQSGHVIFANEHTTGDGILTMLKVLRALQDSGKTMDEWMDMVQLYPQVLVNVPMSNKGAGRHEAVQECMAKLNDELAGADKEKPQGRAFGRDSGTEPLFRVSAERAPTADKIEKQVASLRKHIEKKVALELKPLLKDLGYIKDGQEAA